MYIVISVFVIRSPSPTFIISCLHYPLVTRPQALRKACFEIAENPASRMTGQKLASLTEPCPDLAGI